MGGGTPPYHFPSQIYYCCFQFSMVSIHVQWKSSLLELSSSLTSFQYQIYGCDNFFDNILDRLFPVPQVCNAVFFPVYIMNHTFCNDISLQGNIGYFKYYTIDNISAIILHGLCLLKFTLFSFTGLDINTFETRKWVLVFLFNSSWAD